MTPDKVEEIMSRFDAELFNDDGWNMRMYQETKDWLHTTLTQLQEQHEIEKQEIYESLDANYELICEVEKQKIITQHNKDIKAERDRIASLCYQLDTDGEKMYQLIYKEV